MTEVEKIKKSLDLVFDYINNQNTGVVQTKAINELEYVIKKVENLSIPRVVVPKGTVCSHNGSRFNPRWGEVVCGQCYERIE